MSNDAYLAGFLDGEGTIDFLKRGRNIRVAIMVYNTDIRPLKAFKKAYGGTLGVNRLASGKRKTCYVWQVGVTNGLKMALVRLLPYLLIKADNARKAIRIIKENDEHAKFRPWSEERQL